MIIPYESKWFQNSALPVFVVQTWVQRAPFTRIATKCKSHRRWLPLQCTAHRAYIYIYFFSHPLLGAIYISIWKTPNATASKYHHSQKSRVVHMHSQLPLHVQKTLSAMIPKYHCQQKSVDCDCNAVVFTSLNSQSKRSHNADIHRITNVDVIDCRIKQYVSHMPEKMRRHPEMLTNAILVVLDTLVHKDPPESGLLGSRRRESNPEEKLPQIICLGITNLSAIGLHDPVEVCCHGLIALV